MKFRVKLTVESCSVDDVLYELFRVSNKDVFDINRLTVIKENVYGDEKCLDCSQEAIKSLSNYGLRQTS